MKAANKLVVLPRIAQKFKANVLSDEVAYADLVMLVNNCPYNKMVQRFESDE